MSEFVNGAACEAGVCLWCLTPLNQETSLKNMVCQKCYRLLVRAGLSDAEIFKPKDGDGEKIKN